MSDHSRQRENRAYLKILTVFLVLTAFPLMFCSSKPSKVILGKWKQTGGTEIVEFLKDGTIVITTKDRSMVGKYKFIEDNRLKIEFSGLWGLIGPTVQGVSVTKDQLTLTDAKRKALRYKRIQ